MGANEQRYRQLLAQLLRARQNHDEALEDQILDNMDGVWKAMGALERAAVESVSRELARGSMSEREYLERVDASTEGWSVLIRARRLVADGPTFYAHSDDLTSPVFVYGPEIVTPGIRWASQASTRLEQTGSSLGAQRRM